MCTLLPSSVDMTLAYGAQPIKADLLYVSLLAALAAGFLLYGGALAELLRGLAVHFAAGVLRVEHVRAEEEGLGADQGGGKEDRCSRAQIGRAHV